VVAAVPYRDPDLPTAERVADLLGRMTLEEKLAQLGAVWSSALLEDERFSDEKAREVLARGTGHVTRIAAHTLLGPRDSARLINDIQRFLVEQTRLGIPAILHEESCAGFTARGATQFPQAIGLASTWEPELIEEMASVIRTQMRAVGARQTLAPVLDIARDPRWGRTEETFGEDPYLASRMGVAYVRGVQANALRDGVVATGKHFMGYGASEGGLNWAPAPLPRRELLDRILPPFSAAIHEAGLASVMNGYQEIDGIPCGASKWLLDDLLRGEIGFDGVVVADYYTVVCLMTYHRIAADKSEAAARALEAGLDVELPQLDCFAEPLAEALASERVGVADVDRAVARVLRMKFDLGLFEEACVDPEAADTVFDTPEQRALAREIGRKSLVLLKNEGDVLPLDPGLGRIAVIGPNADSIRHLQGDYHYPTHLELVFGAVQEEGAESAAESVSNVQPGGRRDAVDLLDFFTPTVTILEGIREAVSEATEVRTARGCSVHGEEGRTSRRRWRRPAAPTWRSSSWAGALASAAVVRAARRTIAPMSRCREFRPSSSPRSRGRASRRSSCSSTGAHSRSRTSWIGCRRSWKRGSRAKRAVAPWQTCSSAVSRQRGACRSRCRAPSVSFRSITITSRPAPAASSGATTPICRRRRYSHSVTASPTPRSGTQTWSSRRRRSPRQRRSRSPSTSATRAIARVKRWRSSTCAIASRA